MMLPAVDGSLRRSRRPHPSASATHARRRGRTPRAPQVVALRRRSSRLFVVAAAVAACGIVGTASAVVAPYKNCAQLNARYRHGVGKVGARDHTSGRPVTTFLRSNRLYAVAMQNNRGLDRDHDGIACETA